VRPARPQRASRAKGEDVDVLHRDPASFSTLDEDGVKRMNEATRSAEYALRILANRVLACQMKNCVFASMGTFPMNDDVKHLLE